MKYKNCAIHFFFFSQNKIHLDNIVMNVLFLNKCGHIDRYFRIGSGNVRSFLALATISV